MTTVRMGETELELGSSQLGYLRESNDLLDDDQALRHRLRQEGYLLLRGLQPVAKVEAARDMILEKLEANQQLDRDRPRAEGVTAPGATGALSGGNKAVTRHPLFLELVESEEIMGLFARLLHAEVRTFDHKWLRVVGPGNNTGAHYDVVYMGRGTLNLYTCWTPLGEVSMAMGPLAILEGSHQFDRVKETYGAMDVDRDRTEGWFSTDPLEIVDRHGGHWRTTEFRKGDVLIFGMFTMHASLNNETDRFRLSTDTRYQRADEPMDERWVGEDPLAHSDTASGETIRMEEARARWGV